MELSTNIILKKVFDAFDEANLTIHKDWVAVDMIEFSLRFALSNIDQICDAFLVYHLLQKHKKKLPN